MHTTQLNLETLRIRAAASPRPGSEHLAVRPRPHGPPTPRRSRGALAAVLARAARRLDGEAARRAIA